MDVDEVTETATHDQVLLAVDTSSPERGWEPFLDWLRHEGIPVDDLVSLMVFEDLRVVARYHAHDRHGDYVIDRMHNRTCTYERWGMVRSTPPHHPSRGA